MKVLKITLKYLFAILCITVISGKEAFCDEFSNNETWQKYCTFNGILKDEARWNEEFKMLEEPSDHPNFQKMRAKLVIFITLPNDFINSCPSLKKYLSDLVLYHANNKNIAKEIRIILDYIAQKKLVSK